MQKAIYNNFDYSNRLAISMREYILTRREREILEAFVKNGLKLNGFSVLSIRLKRAYKRLSEDFKLMDAALQKLETS
jgi:hypothetical protein